MSTIPDFSWLAVGKAIHVGSSEFEAYRAAAEAAGVAMLWEAAGEDWPAGSMRGTRLP